MQKPMKPFKSDGCSGGMSWFWKNVLGRPEPWLKSCIIHDRKYWRGGSSHDRFLADIGLLRGVARTGHPYWGMLMFLAVRLFGGPSFPTRWRWGFGYEQNRGYQERDLEAEETSK